MLLILRVSALSWPYLCASDVSSSASSRSGELDGRADEPGLVGERRRLLRRLVDGLRGGRETELGLRRLDDLVVLDAVVAEDDCAEVLKEVVVGGAESSEGERGDSSLIEGEEASEGDHESGNERGTAKRPERDRQK
jgi:hypothetical protein